MEQKIPIWDVYGIFLIYELVLYLLAYFQWPTLNKGIFVLLGLFVTYCSLLYKNRIDEINHS